MLGAERTPEAQAGQVHSCPQAQALTSRLEAGDPVEARREGRADSGKVSAGASICPDSQQLHRVIARLLQMHLLQGLEAGDLFTGKSILITRLSLA